jgi:hypothetical protein
MVLKINTNYFEVTKMKMVISALLITYGLVFLGLSQRYEYNQSYLRVDKLTGQVARCQLVRDDKNICNEVIKGVGIFKGLTNLN